MLMRPLSASQLLDAWEWGWAQPPARQALSLLIVACPEATYETLASASIGQRDAWLLTLREWTFGSLIQATVACPRCGGHLEFACQVSDLRAGGQEAGLPPDSQLMDPLSLSVTCSGYEVRFRLPNSHDLLELAQAGNDLTRAQDALLRRCVQAAGQAGTDLAPADLPEEVLQAVQAEMARADPQAEVMISLNCPACRHSWQALYDVLTFFWSEIDAWARRLLLEVHTLAGAYGWAEADILAMSAWRRQAYTQLAAT